ncbi:unnamed protein product [Callosobruchus maculatus]|uniref:Nuclear condensin complex subunit 3 C-terminal domain-containing protein n=1 Tax=Callosobruchus maculatus TaxID=64391 RepID=A0A653C272_CALMS|nr:unnamed protein product [Callosobruchus maculatus]
MNYRPYDKIKEVLKAAEKSRASHQKCLHTLNGIHKKMGFDDFKEIFLRYLPTIFTTQSLGVKNENLERLLEFLALFVVQTIPTEDNETIPDDPFEDVPSHPFFTAIVMETLEFTRLTDISLRYNSCLYLRLMLDNISRKVSLDYDICERIMEAMLERTTDLEPSIRLQAVMALVNLQNPSDPDCPVLKAYLDLLLDGNALVRAEVVKRIAGYVGSVPYIMRHLRDVNANVRLQAFKRCADMGPKLFKICDRQDILMCGLNETEMRVRKLFQEELLIKWLNAYEGDFIKLLNSIKIDAEETDMLKTQHIGRSIMDVYFKIRPIRDIISSLPLNDDKVIPQEKKVAEVILLWEFLVQHLRKCSGELNMDIEEILPELTPFCEYIQSTVNTAKDKNMKDWEYLEYQQILHSLFQIAEGYDFSDEVGRKTLNEMVLTMLRDEKNQLRIKRKLLKIASELDPKSDITSAVCCLISDIREPLIDVEEVILPPTSSKYDNHEFHVARLRVKLNTLEIEVEEASDLRDFSRAAKLEEEAKKIREEIAALIESRAVPQVKVSQVKTVKDDPKTVSHCLDLLIALLELPSVRKISAALESIKNNFLLPLLDSSTPDINWRVLQCLALFATMSIELAEEYLKVLCIPLMTCRVIPNYNKCALMVSIKSLSDLYHLYGAQIFGGFNGTSNASQNWNTNLSRRWLYDDVVEESNVDPNNFQFENVIDILMDLVDEEDVEIYECSTKALGRLILNSFPVSPPFIIRIILKWYNPATAKSTNQVQQALGVMIAMYASKVKGAKETIAKVVLPILRKVACVPKADPLSEIDTNNLLNFLAVLTSSANEKEATDLHLKLTRLIFTEIVKSRNHVLLGYLTKLLTFLNIPVGDKEAVNNIIEHAEELSSDKDLPLDKMSRKCIKKFVQKIKNSVEQIDRDKECANDKTTDTESMPTNTEINNSTVASSLPSNDPTGAGDSIKENTEKAPKINSNTEVTRSPLRESKRIRTPNKKYDEYIKHGVKTRKNRVNKHVEDTSMHSLNDSVGEDPKSRKVDTERQDISSIEQSFSEDRSSPTKRDTRLSRNSNDELPNNNNKEENNRDVRSNEKGSKDTDNGVSTKERQDISSRDQSSSDDLSSPTKRDTRRSRNRNDKLPDKNNEDGKNKDVRSNEKGSSKDKENGVSTKDPKTRKVDAERQGIRSRDQSSSDDLSSPTTRDTRRSRNRNDKLTNKNDTDGKNRDVRSNEKASKDKENGVSMKVADPKTGKVDRERQGISSTEQSDDLSSPRKRDTRRSRNKNELLNKNNTSEKNREMRSNEKGSKDKENGVSNKDPKTRNVDKHGISSREQSSSDDLWTPTKRGTRRSRNKNNTDGKNKDMGTNEKGSKDKENRVSTKDPKTRKVDAERQGISSSDQSSSSSDDLSSPTKRDTRRSRNKNDKLPNKNDTDGKNRDEKVSKDKESGVSTKERQSISSKEQASSDDLSSPTKRDTRHSRNRNDKLPSKDNTEGKNRDVGTNEKGSKDKENGVSTRGSTTRYVDTESQGSSSKKQCFSDDRSSPTKQYTSHSRNRNDKPANKNHKDGTNKDVRTNEKGSKDKDKDASTKGSEGRMKKRPRVLSKENVSSDPEKPDNSDVSQDSEVLQQRSKRCKLAQLEKQITKGERSDSAKQKSNSSAPGKNDEASQQNPNKETLEGRMNKRTRVLSKENVSTDSEKADGSNVKRPRLTRQEKQIARCTRLDSAKKNSILSEHNDSSYTKNGSFRPIAESTACTIPVASGSSSTGTNNRALTRSLGRLSEKSESELDRSRLSDRSLLVVVKSVAAKVMNRSVSSFDSETSYKTRSSRSAKSSPRNSPATRSQRINHIPNIIKITYSSGSSFTSEATYKSKSSSSSTRSSPIISRHRRKIPNIMKNLRNRKIQLE